jgi:amidohydrolase
VTSTTTAAELAELHATLQAGLAAELDFAIGLRRELHAAADLSGSEEPTAARVAAALGEPDAAKVAGTGRLVRIGPATGPTIAIRGELDGLPVVEQTGVPWASRTDAMHACGHDVHLAALVALGRAARAVELPTALLAVLQPREETFPSGAQDIVTSGELARQQPLAMIGVHLQHQLAPGTVAATPGTVNASSDEVEITVTGRGGHAGYPHLAVNPVPALCAAVVALAQVTSRFADPTHAVVASIGAIEGGRAANVIPETARARGSLRALDPADRDGLHQVVREIVTNVCRGYGCEATVELELGEPALVNDQALAAASWPWLRQAGFAVNDSLRSCGADDFSHYVELAPTLMMFAGTHDDLPLHHPRFLPPDETVGEVASAMLAGYVAALSGPTGTPLWAIAGADAGSPGSITSSRSVSSMSAGSMRIRSSRLQCRSESASSRLACRRRARSSAFLTLRPLANHDVASPRAR